jgi:PAS domain S-box-containing protein
MKSFCAFRWQSWTGHVYASADLWELLDIPPKIPASVNHVFQRAHVFDRAEIHVTLMEATRDRSGFDCEWRFVMADDTVKVVRVEVQAISDEAGRVEHVGWMAEVVDAAHPLVISAVELQKARSEAKQFHLTLEQAPGLLWSALPNGFIDFLNQRWLEYTGMALEDACGWGWQVCIHPEDLPMLMTIWRELIDTAQAGEAKARMRHHDGSYRWFLFRVTPFFDGEGQLAKWYGQTIDIEELKRAEDLLEADRTVLEMLARSASLGATLDTTCRLVDGMLPGCTASVWLLGEDGSTVSEFVAPGLPRAFIDDLQALIENTGGGKMSLYAGPCASAIQHRKTIVIPDISVSTGWVEYCQLAIPYGFKSVVCAPITASDNRILGMFVLQSREAGEPTAYQRSNLEHFTHMSAMAVERRHMDEALRDSEERFRLMAETTPDVIWITDLHPERVLYCSPSFEKLWGLQVEALYRDPDLWRASIHAEDARHVAEVFQRGISTPGGGQYDVEYRLQRADGSICWIYERAVMLAERGALPHRMSGISTDITGRKLAEEALRESRERFELAVAASSDGIWDWDIRSDRVYMSEQAQCIVRAPAGVSQLHYAEWKSVLRLHPEDEKRFTLLLEDYLAGSVPAFIGEWRLQDAEGVSRWVRIRGLCLRDEAGHAQRLAGSISDIDEQKRAEAMQQQSRRLEAMGTLAGGIAHDFNNILGVILGYCEMALRSATSGSRLRRDLDNIMSAGERGRSLVDRILTFSRGSNSERIPVHVEAVVQESIDLLEATLPANIELAATLRTGFAAMLGDPTQVHQVVMNLVTNAIQAMPGGGRIQVRLQPETVRAPLITTTGVLNPGAYLVLQVEDQGTGIAPEVLERIFDPFFTTKEVGVGTGLGLSLVHGIVLDVGGVINVATRIGRGSTFTAYLPHTGEASRPGLEAAARWAGGHGERVLLVDDEESLLRLAEETLRDLGYEPASFTSSVAALEAFRLAPGGFDAVLTDERMPGLTGSALIGQVRMLRPDIPTLLMTGYLGDVVARPSGEPVADEILKKPLAFQDLARSLATALARGA